MTARFPWRTARLEVVADGFHFLEGPRWRDGLLYLSDFYGHRVLTVDPAGTVRTVCRVPAQPSGLGWTPDGDLLVVSMLDMSLLRLHDGALSLVADLSPWTGGVTNDMIVDRRGRAYVGNVGDRSEGSVAPTVLLRVDPGGAVTAVADGLYAPNGAVFTPGEATLVLGRRRERARGPARRPGRPDPGRHRDRRPFGLRGRTRGNRRPHPVPVCRAARPRL